MLVVPYVSVAKRYKIPVKIGASYFLNASSYPSKRCIGSSEREREREGGEREGGDRY
jgi:hypothetical protein